MTDVTLDLDDLLAKTEAVIREKVELTVATSNSALAGWLEATQPQTVRALIAAARERDRLRETLEKVVKCSDDGLAKCPVNNGAQKVKGDPCERCGAKTNENCGLTVSADSAAIELARAALL